MNLFILVLVQQFEEYQINRNNPLNSWFGIFNSFRNIWIMNAETNHQMFLNDKKILSIFNKFDPPIGS